MHYDLINKFRPKLKHLKNVRRRGFTLVEILVVIGILGLTTSALLYFLISTVKSSNQSNVVAEVQQNGQAILNSLSSQIKNGASVSYNYSDTLNCVPPNATVPTNCLIVQRQGGNNPLYIKYFPVVFDNSTPPIATSNGYVATCTDDSTGTFCASPPTHYVTLTNQDPISGVSVVLNPGIAVGTTVPFFSIYSPQGVPSTVIINFSLTQAFGATSRQDFQAAIPFQTTLTLGSY